jgi:hypothetical protein
VAATASKSYEVKFIGNTAGLTKSFKDIEKHGRAMGNTFGGITQSISKSFISTGQSLTRNVTLPLAGLGVVMNKTVTDASNLAEAEAKVNAVFKTQAGELAKWSKTTSASLGVSTRAALEAAGTYGNLFQAFGIGQAESAKMSMRLVELAADMASFNNVPIDDALTALRSGLSGETEPLKRFGVALNDVRLRQEALNLGIYNGQGVLTVAQKSQAAYALILRDTALQQGDVARTAGGLANQKKFLGAQIEDLSGSFGAVLMPIMINVVGVIRNQVLPVMQRFIEAFKTLSPEAVVTAIQIGFFAAALGPAMVAVGYMIKMVQGLATAFQFLVKRVVLIPTVILLIIAAFVKGTDATMSWGQAIFKTIRGVVIAFVQVGNAVSAATNILIKGYNAFQRVLESGDVIKEVGNLDFLIKGIDSAGVAYGNFSKQLKEEQSNLSDIANEAKKLSEAIDTPGGGGGGGGSKKSVGGASKSAAEKIAKFGEALTGANGILQDAQQKFKDYASSVSTSISQIVNFGSAQNSSTDSITKAKEAQLDLVKAQENYDKALKTDNIEAQEEALKSLQDAQKAATDSVTNRKTFLQVLQDQASLASQFSDKVKTLISMGLSETAIGQVLQAGADAGTKIADEIIAGGATVVDQVNTLTSATQSVADAVGESAATQFYSAGVAAGQALVDGVKAAIAAAGLSVTATGSIVNQAGIDQVNSAIAKARGKKSKSGTKISKGERQSIMDLAASLGVEVPAFAKGGIVTGPTLALIGEAGPEAVVPLSGRNAGGLGSQITINVNAGMGADGASIGRDIVDAIKRYERTSGPVFASA